MATKVEKVLWFVPTLPAEVRRRVGAGAAGRGSWIESLRCILVDDGMVELVVASASAYEYEPFEAEGVRYQNIRIPSTTATRMGRWAKNWGFSQHENLVVARALAVVRAVAPDVVHVHGTEGVLGAAAHLCGRPVVISLQGLLTACQRHYFDGMRTIDVLRTLGSWESIRGTGVIHGYRNMRARARREQQVVARNRFFIGRTAWDRAVLAALNPRASYFHCDEVIRPEFYSVTWEPPRHGQKIIFSTSSSMPFKGSECLLEAVAILKAAGMPDLHVRIAGVPAGSQVDQFYRSRARALGLVDGVSWTGPISGARLADELAHCHVFVYPTHIDNSPNALAEAMIVGVPTVASYVGGIPSLLRHDEEGLLFPDGDQFALAAAIRRLLEDAPVSRSLAERARVAAHTRHRPETIAARMMEIYTTVLGENSVGRS